MDRDKVLSEMAKRGAAQYPYTPPAKEYKLGPNEAWFKTIVIRDYDTPKPCKKSFWKEFCNFAKERPVEFILFLVCSSPYTGGIVYMVYQLFR